MAITVTTSLDYMIDDLRFHMGDITLPYTYPDVDLRHALVMACKGLMRKWSNRYLISGTYVVSRNTDRVYRLDAPPIIERSDERCFILQGAIILKAANLQNSIWDLGSWRDDEISRSNIEGGRAIRESIHADMDELAQLLKRRLYGATRASLPGFQLPINVREGYS